MIEPAQLFEQFRDEGIDFFAGVPDSLLKEFCAYVTAHARSEGHVITANEGNAVAMAAGHYLGSGHPALVYMQNSGLGNTVNPLLSLADEEVYGLPMLLLIGWRGEPGVKDEPQHIKQGRVTPALLDAMEIPWFILESESDSGAVVAKAMASMRERGAPVALLVRKGAFASAGTETERGEKYPMTREQGIWSVVDSLGGVDTVVAATGMPSRELYEYRDARGDGHGNDFLTVGSMGHTASIAQGLAASRPGERVVCLDGDGGILMHMGSLAILGQQGPSNLLHVVLNNGAHDSVGGQPTVGFGVDFVTIALACGYRQARSVSDPEAITEVLAEWRNEAGPLLLEIRVARGARADLGRPATTPAENRDALMQRLNLPGG